jgi:TonB family protein
MCRITIRLVVALLTFAVGVASFALITGLRSDAKRRPSVSMSIDTPTAPQTSDMGVTISSRCGCNESYNPPASTRPESPINGGILNGKALSLPKPPYPPIAKTAQVSGTVLVQVVVDERGCVIAAHAVSGHPLLQAAAVAAARQACFSPTRLSGEPVKVSGVIAYNFLLP